MMTTTTERLLALAAEWATAADTRLRRLLYEGNAL